MSSDPKEKKGLPFSGSDIGGLGIGGGVAIFCVLAALSWGIRALGSAIDDNVKVVFIVLIAGGIGMAMFGGKKKPSNGGGKPPDKPADKPKPDEKPH